MDGLRNEINETKTEFPNDAAMHAELGSAETSWINMRDIYCGHCHGAPYTDLRGNTQTCQ